MTRRFCLRGSWELREFPQPCISRRQPPLPQAMEPKRLWLARRGSVLVECRCPSPHGRGKRINIYDCGGWEMELGFEADCPVSEMAGA